MKPCQPTSGAIHTEVRQQYGWPMMWKELVIRGIRVGKERERKLMKLHGIKARGKEPVRNFVCEAYHVTKEHVSRARQGRPQPHRRCQPYP
ncbi:hypothetical protein RF819_17075 [Rhodoferax fermentans]|uniref:HTH-like domain-containing protein n=1 Tax=Rhodoferax fermentans TaxID=28066 RepID=A0A1T1AVQ8_RHOFE|nr:hypothetical protein RF819_17075 [Rhodoferax fermentans]